MSRKTEMPAPVKCYALVRRFGLGWLLLALNCQPLPQTLFGDPLESPQQTRAFPRACP